MRIRNAAAVARATLFRRVRTVLIRAQGPGLVANTLNFDYEVRNARVVFRGIPEFEIEGEMLDLARHIIRTRSGRFDPAAFDDRYEAALAALVLAKAEGRTIARPRRPIEAKIVNLLDALRASAGGEPDGQNPDDRNPDGQNPDGRTPGGRTPEGRKAGGRPAGKAGTGRKRGGSPPPRRRTG